MNSEKIKNLLQPIFEKEPRVGLLYLFGSQATGKADKRSDYDFGAYFDEADAVKRHEIMFRVAGKISDALKSDSIDIHSLNDLQAPELKYRIIQDGVLIFEREPYRILVEPRILNEYFDFIYLLRKYHLTNV